MHAYLVQLMHFLLAGLQWFPPMYVCFLSYTDGKRTKPIISSKLKGELINTTNLVWSCAHRMKSRHERRTCNACCEMDTSCWNAKVTSATEGAIRHNGSGYLSVQNSCWNHGRGPLLVTESTDSADEGLKSHKSTAANEKWNKKTNRPVVVLEACG